MKKKKIAKLITACMIAVSLKPVKKGNTYERIEVKPTTKEPSPIEKVIDKTRQYCDKPALDMIDSIRGAYSAMLGSTAFVTAPGQGNKHATVLPPDTHQPIAVIRNGKQIKLQPDTKGNITLQHGDIGIFQGFDGGFSTEERRAKDVRAANIAAERVNAREFAREITPKEVIDSQAKTITRQAKELEDLHKKVVALEYPYKPEFYKTAYDRFFAANPSCCYAPGDLNIPLTNMVSILANNLTWARDRSAEKDTLTSELRTQLSSLTLELTDVKLKNQLLTEQLATCQANKERAVTELGQAKRTLNTYRSFFDGINYIYGTSPDPTTAMARISAELKLLEQALSPYPSTKGKVDPPVSIPVDKLDKEIYKCDVGLPPETPIGKTNFPEIVTLFINFLDDLCAYDVGIAPKGTTLSTMIMKLFESPLIDWSTFKSKYFTTNHAVLNDLLVEAKLDPLPVERGGAGGLISTPEFIKQMAEEADLRCYVVGCNKRPTTIIESWQGCDDHKERPSQSKEDLITATERATNNQLSVYLNSRCTATVTKGTKFCSKHKPVLAVNAPNYDALEADAPNYGACAYCKNCHREADPDSDYCSWCIQNGNAGDGGKK